MECSKEKFFKKTELIKKGIEEIGKEKKYDRYISGKHSSDSVVIGELNHMRIISEEILLKKLNSQITGRGD